MTVRCKFTCVSKREYKQWGTPGTVYDYEFTAVTNDSSAENKSFWKLTPSGKLNVGVASDGTFTVGADYYLDITPTLAPAAATDNMFNTV